MPSSNSFKQFRHKGDGSINGSCKWYRLERKSYLLRNISGVHNTRTSQMWITYYVLLGVKRRTVSRLINIKLALFAFFTRNDLLRDIYRAKLKALYFKGGWKHEERLRRFFLWTCQNLKRFYTLFIAGAVKGTNMRLKVLIKRFVFTVLQNHVDWYEYF